MRRRLLNLLTAVSLLLCVGVAVFWARSDSVGYGVTVPLSRRSCLMLQTYPGRFAARYVSDFDNYGAPPHFFAERWNESAIRDGVLAQHWGSVPTTAFEWHWGAGHARLVAPFWVMIGTLLAVSALRLLAANPFRRQHNPSYCTNCGYDLRGTPGRCPECGTAATTPT